MEAESEAQHFALLEKALKLDPGNVDVLLALLPYDLDAIDDEIAALRKIVHLAEGRLGPKAFKEMAGAFWGFHETRPYMRARCRLAETLRTAGRIPEAIEEYEGMLQLNPNDNQGIRYSLLACLLMENRLQEVRNLFEAYADEEKWSVAFAWGHVLERFLSGDLPGAKAALAAAKKQNPHMLGYIKGVKLLRPAPPSYAPGSKEEALSFAELLYKMWATHPAAREWLDAQKAR